VYSRDTGRGNSREGGGDRWRQDPAVDRHHLTAHPAPARVPVLHRVALGECRAAAGAARRRRHRVLPRQRQRRSVVHARPLVVIAPQPRRVSRRPRPRSRLRPRATPRRHHARRGIAHV